MNFDDVTAQPTYLSMGYLVYVTAGMDPWNDHVKISSTNTPSHGPDTKVHF